MPPDPPDERHHRAPADRAGKLAHFAGLGIEETVVQLPAAGEAEVLRTLDAYQPYVDAADEVDRQGS
ncbi:hypothetical protein [Streptomyces sp. NPDC004976]